MSASTSKFSSFLTYALSGAGAIGGSTAFWFYYELRNRLDNMEASHINVLDQQIKKWDKDWDKRDPATLIVEKKTKSPIENENLLIENKATAKRHLIFIRHGQSNTAAKNAEERNLTELGRVQAEKVAQRLKELDLPYKNILSSTMLRAHETADIIQKHLPHLNLIAMDILLEGVPVAPDPPTKWIDAERIVHENARLDYAFRHLIHRAPPTQKTDSYEIIVSHANVIRYFVCRALQIPPEAWLRFTLFHGSITWLTIRPNGNVSLLSLSDCGNLSPDEMTYSA